MAANSLAQYPVYPSPSNDAALIDGCAAFLEAEAAWRERSWAHPANDETPEDRNHEAAQRRRANHLATLRAHTLAGHQARARVIAGLDHLGCRPENLDEAMIAAALIRDLTLSDAGGQAVQGQDNMLVLVCGEYAAAMNAHLTPTTRLYRAAEAKRVALIGESRAVSLGGHRARARALLALTPLEILEEERAIIEDEESDLWFALLRDLGDDAATPDRLA